MRPTRAVIWSTFSRIRRPAFCNENVPRFHVAVNDARIVGGLKRIRDLRDNFQLHF